MLRTEDDSYDWPEPMSVGHAALRMHDQWPEALEGVLNERDLTRDFKLA